MKNPIKLLAIIITLSSMLNSCSNEQNDTTAGYKQMIDKYVEFWNTGQFENINDVLL